MLGTGAVGLGIIEGPFRVETHSLAAVHSDHDTCQEADECWWIGDINSKQRIETVNTALAETSQAASLLLHWMITNKGNTGHLKNK